MKNILFFNEARELKFKLKQQKYKYPIIINTN